MDIRQSLQIRIHPLNQGFLDDSQSHSLEDALRRKDPLTWVLRRSGSGILTLAEPSESDASAKAAKSLSSSDFGM